MAEEKMTRKTGALYKDSPTMKRDAEDGKMKPTKKADTALNKDEARPGDAGEMPMVAKHVLERHQMMAKHIGERMEMHGRHEHEHHLVAGVGRMAMTHDRHEKELGEMHRGHEKEMVAMHDRHEKEMAGK